MRLRQKLLIAIILAAFTYLYYYAAWGKHIYTITAYCDCPICINIEKFQDRHFASGKKVYWGGVATDPSVAFGSSLELVPLWPQDWFAVKDLLKGRRDFIVEDRGGMIKGRRVDLFIPDSMGGHQHALNWGVRKMRVKVNGSWKSS